MDKIVYQNGSVIVSETIFKTARRTYKIGFIERIQIKRPWLMFSLPMSLGCTALLSEYSPYLYSYEITFCAVTAIFLPIVTWFIGTLSITSKSYTSDNALTGFMPKLKRARDAIEMVLYQNNVH